MRKLKWPQLYLAWNLSHKVKLHREDSMRVNEKGAKNCGHHIWHEILHIKSISSMKQGASQ